MRTYLRSQLGKVNQVGNGKREKKRERPKKRWLDEVTEKNGTQTKWHIKPMVQIVVNGKKQFTKSPSRVNNDLTDDDDDDE